MKLLSCLNEPLKWRLGTLDTEVSLSSLIFACHASPRRCARMKWRNWRSCGNGSANSVNQRQGRSGEKPLNGQETFDMQKIS